MLLTRATLEAIAGGTVTLAFRRWRRPTVRTGGTLTTAVGVLSIDDVSPIDLGDITESDARASGHADLKTLRGLLSKGAGRTVYRIALRRRGPDPCIALRAAVPSAADMDRIEARMARWDSASSIGTVDAEGIEVADRQRSATLESARGEASLLDEEGDGNGTRETVRRLKAAVD